MDRLWSLFEHSSDAAFAVDDKKRIVFWNQAAQTLLGYPPEMMIGQRCWHLLQSKTPNSLPFCSPDCTIMQQVRAGVLVQNVDIAMQTYAGPVIPVNMSTIPFPLQGQNGSQIYLVHLLRPLPSPETQFGVLRLYLLGPLRVQRIDGSFVNGPHWQTPATRALLIYLSKQRGRVVSARQIAADLWPQHPSPAALEHLETAVHHLQRALQPSLPCPPHKPPIISRQGDGYRFDDQAPCWFDLNHAARQLEAARREPNPHQARSIYQEVLRLFRGDYLADLSRTPVWSPEEHQRARALHLTALEELGGLCEQDNQLEAAKKLYLGALALDPENGRVYHKLTHLALPRNDKLEALARCRQLTAALRGGLEALLDDHLHDLLTNP